MNYSASIRLTRKQEDGGRRERGGREGRAQREEGGRGRVMQPTGWDGEGAQEKGRGKLNELELRGDGKRIRGVYKGVMEEWGDEGLKDERKRVGKTGGWVEVDDSQSRDRKIKGRKDGEVESRARGFEMGVKKGQEVNRDRSLERRDKKGGDE